MPREEGEVTLNIGEPSPTLSEADGDPKVDLLEEAVRCIREAQQENNDNKEEVINNAYLYNGLFGGTFKVEVLEKAFQAQQVPKTL